MSSSPSTQDHLPIAGIQDNVVIMTDGSIRVVLKVEPINFELKSENEQNAIIYSYQAFLNSLDAPIQIVIQSKRLDLEQYLVKMQEFEHQQTNELLRIQTEDYIGFVRRLISVANIMAKRFYVVVSHSVVSKSSSLNQITSLFSHKPSGPLLDQDEFDRLCKEAYNKASIAAGGLGRLGAKARALETQELIELFYGIYNPDVATEERLTDLSTLNSGVITSPAAVALAPQPAEASTETPPAEAPAPEAPATTVSTPEPAPETPTSTPQP
jgi:type IV secretory pathway VirB4 component